MLSFAGLRRFDAAVVPDAVAVSFRHGPTPSLRKRYAPFSPDSGNAQLERPAAIINLGRIRSIPFLLGALSVLTIAHEMITSIRSRRRDVAVLRSMGADRSWISRAIHWQATAIVVLPIAIGTPLGLIAGASSSASSPTASAPSTMPPSRSCRSRW